MLLASNKIGSRCNGCNACYMLDAQLWSEASGLEVNSEYLALSALHGATMKSTVVCGAVQLITVFDADMVCSPDFFIKTLPRIMDDRVSLVLTPQAYHNYNPSLDIFNHSAFAYWSIMVPGEDAWGHIVCTGKFADLAV